MTDKIFIDREASTGDFLMRMPAEALPDFYEMLCASPLLSRRWFYQAKEHLESNYRDEITRKVTAGIPLDETGKEVSHAAV